MNTNVYLYQYLAGLLNVSDESRAENKTHILCSMTLSRESCHLCDNMEKYGTAGQTTDDDVAHAHYILDN